MVDTAEVRRHNLKQLVLKYEGMNNLARALGLTKGAYISQILSTQLADKNKRVMSEKTARKWERMLGLPVGWMDTPTDAFGAPVGASKALSPGLLADTVTTVLEALKAAKVTLDSNQVADLIVLQYTDAAQMGRTDKTRVEKIVGLLRR